MSSSVVTSLTKSFNTVPSAAIPSILDCILASTGLSSSSLFDSLLDNFSTHIKNFFEEDHGKMDSAQCGYISSFTNALCYLLNKSGTQPSDLQSFIWRAFIPVMKIVNANEHELLGLIAEQISDVVTKSNTWEVIGASLVPFALRSVGLCIGMHQNEESAIYQWSGHSVIGGEGILLNGLDEDKEPMSPLYDTLPLAISCHILTSLLVASLRHCQALRSPLEQTVLVGCSAENFYRNLLWDVCGMAIRMLLQCPEHRSCTIHLLLPFVLRTFACHTSFQVSVHRQKHVLSGDSFSRNIWDCCRALFTLGSLERRDAYSVLSLYLSIFFREEGCEVIGVCNGAPDFDIRAEQGFWDEIKRGLVNKEVFVRKQSLDMLKMSLLKHDGTQRDAVVSEKDLDENYSTSIGSTRRGQWAEKEAKSLGVGQICNLTDTCSNGQQKWDAFILLYEMLEEYGTHLVEAAWNHQISMLLHIPCLQRSGNAIGGVHQSQMETLEEMFSWLAILWERGLCHDNPQVRCLIMQSFLSVEWKNHGNCAEIVPESFIFGPFIQGLNDTVHHREFGVKGFYSSKTIEGATTFVSHFCKHFHLRERIAFMCSLASLVKQESFGRAGLMALSACIASAACGVQWCEVCSSDVEHQISFEASLLCNSKTDLLDILRLLIQSCKQHFNLNYRRQVCENVVEAASSVICTSDVPLETLMHFISVVPRKYTDYDGPLRGKVQNWFSKCSQTLQHSESFSTREHVLHSLCAFPERYTEYHHSPEAFVTYDDGDLQAWEFEAQRWARVLLLVITTKHHLELICEFLQDCGINICKQNKFMEWLPQKFLILNSSLVQELQIMHMKSIGCGIKVRSNMESHMLDRPARLGSLDASIIFEKFTFTFLFILEELVSYAKSICSAFWSCPNLDSSLPSSVRGKLGGPSQRRLASSTTSAVSEAILSMKTVASVASWCTRFKRDDDSLDLIFTFLWSFSHKVILSKHFDLDSETGAEICLAAYEALVPVLKAVASSMTPKIFDLVMASDRSLMPKAEDRHWLETLIICFLENINELLAVGMLARSRRAILMNWKWLCLNSLLSILCWMMENEVHPDNAATFVSTTSLNCIFSDLIGSLENANESSVLPMLISVRMVMGLYASERLGSIVFSSDGMKTEMMWDLVRSSWILHVSCKKRKVAHIAALLSSVLHFSVFCDDRMHETAENTQGPCKWFIEKIIEEATKSPRTIRLAALHLTGLWLMYPRTIRYYVKELKLLSLHGSVAFDEDFEAELAESHDARTEVSLLAKGSDIELTEAFMNTELYARVSVAVLFHELANRADRLGSVKENEDRHAALHAGKSFLLELLDSVVNDKDLAKELYKKYSGIHRRKVRAWQMICILSRFVDEDIVQQVTASLHITIYRNNMPSIRQYLETFAIQIYLKFPSLVKEQLSPIFQDHNMRPQALSSYVFIAANVILHTTEEIVRFRHLNELLPPITPLLTSHHHSLRGFAQLLVYQVLSKMFPALDCDGSHILSLETRCFKDLKSYLAKNSDCARLRASMQGFLDAFDPIAFATPNGIFTARDEGFEFECVPTSLMEQVNLFLNEVREDLRCSMAKDMVTIKNESLIIGDNFNGTNASTTANKEALPSQVPKEISLDFQKKITLSNHERHYDDVTGEQLAELEKEDQLLNQVLQARCLIAEKMRASRQDFILVASLLDRIPNLAGLARTCEVFKASGLAVADASIVNDKQFQLISVTAEKWVPLIEVPVSTIKVFLRKKKQEGYSILGLEQTANSVPLDQYAFPKKMVLVLGREKEGIPVDIIHILDACIEIPQLGVVRSLNVHVSGAIALWEYTRQQRLLQS